MSVKVLSDVAWPIAPVTPTVPAAPPFKVSDWVLAMVPFTAPLMAMAPPAVLSVRSLFNTSAVLLSPKVMAVLVVLTVPPKLSALGAVATKPPSNANTSADELPNVKVPVFRKFVALVTCVLAPTKAKL